MHHHQVPDLEQTLAAMPLQTSLSSDNFKKFKPLPCPPVAELQRLSRNVILCLPSTFPVKDKNSKPLRLHTCPKNSILKAFFYNFPLLEPHPLDFKENHYILHNVTSNRKLTLRPYPCARSGFETIEITSVNFIIQLTHRNEINTCLFPLAFHMNSEEA